MPLEIVEEERTMGRLIQIEPHTQAIQEVVLCRSERRNALCIELLEQLGDALEGLASDRQVRVLILRGEGPVFSAGLDLKEAAQEELVEHSAAGLKRVLELLREIPLVTIAAVQGGAYAGGAGVMAACDLVVAAEDAKIGFPEARRGFLPALICRVLRHKVREGDLRDLFLVGEPFDAKRALQLGLVQYVVSPDAVITEARRLASSVVAGGPDTIRNTKRLLNEMFATPDETLGLSLEELHLDARRSTEAQEGLAAFAEKRKPVWIKD